MKKSCVHLLLSITICSLTTNVTHASFLSSLKKNFPLIGYNPKTVLKSTLCLAALSTGGVRSAFSIKPIAGQKTQEAMLDLAALWSEHEFPQFNIKPSLRDLNTSSNETTPLTEDQKLEIAERFMGIETHYKLQTVGEEGNKSNSPKTELFGLTINGKKQIEEFLNDWEESLSIMNFNAAGTTMARAGETWNLISNGIIMLPFLMGLGLASLTPIMQNFLQNHSSEVTMIAPLIGLVFMALAAFPSEFLTQTNKDMNEPNRIEKLKDQLNQSDFIHMSWGLRLSQKSIDSILLSSNADRKNDTSLTDTVEIYGGYLNSLALTLNSMSRNAKPTEPRLHVQVDMIYSSGEDSGSEPRFLLFFRTSERKPKFNPPASSKKNEELEKTLSLELGDKLTPAHIPVKK